MFRLASQPAIASASISADTMVTPSARSTIRPPAMVPIRMARKVPASIRPLPPTSSSSPRWFGRMPYLTGPKNADCAPSRNSTAISR